MHQIPHLDDARAVAHVLGVDGAVGSTYNFLGETMGLVLAPFAAGGSGDVSAAALELARTVQLSNARLISIVVDWTNGVGAGANRIKETENLVAVATGPPRLPYLEATPAARAALASALKGWCAELKRCRSSMQSARRSFMSWFTNRMSSR